MLSVGCIGKGVTACFGIYEDIYSFEAQPVDFTTGISGTPYAERVPGKPSGIGSEGV